MTSGTLGVHSSSQIITAYQSGQMPFMLPCQQCQSTEGTSWYILICLDNIVHCAELMIRNREDEDEDMEEAIQKRRGRRKKKKKASKVAKKEKEVIEEMKIAEDCEQTG